jgi:hypothetical protein
VSQSRPLRAKIEEELPRRRRIHKVNGIVQGGAALRKYYGLRRIALKELEKETPVNPVMTRRQLLKAAAGGVTFLALAPIGKGLFAATLPTRHAEPALPLFTALPYIQHGGGDGKLVNGQESIVVAWQTNGVAAGPGISPMASSGSTLPPPSPASI